ncbi:uncharacterized protein [Diadema antillarum]|uniref:uncharacterized protein n=1 Tax=Diadema antillarum TaxID=105358 RepID=UPI003A8583E1
MEQGEENRSGSPAPLDLRVKKEVKKEPLTPENAPLNLTKPLPQLAPSPTKAVKTETAKTVDRYTGGGDESVKGHLNVPPNTKAALISHSVVPIDPRHHLHAMIPPHIDIPSRSSPGPTSTGSPKQRAGQSPDSHATHRQLLAGHTGEGGSGTPSPANSDRTISSLLRGTAMPATSVTTLTSVPSQTVNSPSPSPAKKHKQHVAPAQPPVAGTFLQVRLPSPGTNTKKSVGPVADIRAAPSEAKPPTTMVSKISPTSKIHAKKTSKGYQTTTAIASQPGVQHGSERLATHVTPARSMSVPQHSGQAHASQVTYPVHGPLLPHALIQQRPPAGPHRGTGTSQVHELLALAPKPRSVVPPIAQLHAAHIRAAAQSHIPTPATEALLKLRPPAVTTSPQETLSQPAKASFPPPVLVSSQHPPPVAPPSLSPQPKPQLKIGPPRSSPPQVAPPLSSQPSQPPVTHPQPPTLPHPQNLHEVPPERVLHQAAGQGYISPTREFYPLAPVVRGVAPTAVQAGPLPTSAPEPSISSGAPPIVQTPGPAQTSVPRYQAAASFAVNPFVSLSIAIDCQRATEQDTDGDTALHIAIVQDQPDMGLIRRLIELVRLAGKSVDIFNYMQQTPLHLACIMQNSDIIRLLVEAGANPNEADRNGQTAAHHACKNGSAGCLGAILRYSQVDVNLNIRNYEGYTPLHLAAMIGNPTLVTMLLEKGADLNSKDSKNGWTPLFHAVTNQDTKLVHKMLSSGAEVNVQSYSGNTVLHVATGRGYTDIVKILVHYGADMSLKNTQWDTPATITTDKTMSTLLRGLGAGSPQPNDTSSPSAATPAPNLPIPINDAYLIRPATVATTSAPSTASKPSTVTTLTTERLKGPANEVYTVTRSVTRQDSVNAGARCRSPEGQRAIHKQTQERLRNSIQFRKVVNELRSESQQRRPEGGPPTTNSEKVVVLIPSRVDKEGRISVIEKEAEAGSGSSERNAFFTQLEEKVNASTTASVMKSKDVSKVPNHATSHPAAHSVMVNIQPRQTPDVVPSSERGVSRLSPATGSSPSKVKMEDRRVKTEYAYLIHKDAPVVPSVNGHIGALLLNTSGDSEKKVNNVSNLPLPRDPKPEPKSAEGSPRRNESAPSSQCPEAAIKPATPTVLSTVESENELRKSMLSLQFKNSGAFLGIRHEKKAEQVTSDQEREEAASAILAIGSACIKQSAAQRQASQTCDADSTVKSEPISPTPVLSSTSDTTPSSHSRPLSPPVLEREGDKPPPPLRLAEYDDDEPSLVIDESFKMKSRKKTRTPTKSVPNLSPMTPEYTGTSSDSVKLGKVKVTDPKKLWKKKALATMAEAEPKRKRKKSEKSSKELL